MFDRLGCRMEQKERPKRDRLIARVVFTVNEVLEIDFIDCKYTLKKPNRYYLQNLLYFVNFYIFVTPRGSFLR